MSVCVQTLRETQRDKRWTQDTELDNNPNSRYFLQVRCGYIHWDVAFRVCGGNDVAILSGMWLYSLRDVAISKFDYSVSSTELDNISILQESCSQQLTCQMNKYTK